MSNLQKQLKDLELNKQHYHNLYIECKNKINIIQQEIENICKHSWNFNCEKCQLCGKSNQLCGWDFNISPKELKEKLSSSF
jgi:phosphoribosyl-dephospho-CoA transferase